MAIDAHNHLGMAREELSVAGSSVAKALRRTDPLEAVPFIQAAIAHLEAARQEMVLEARHDGRSWEIIGSQFGITRQGARQRFETPGH